MIVIVLTVVAGLGFFSWLVAVLSAIQLVRLSPKGMGLKVYGWLGWWQFDSVRQALGPSADQHIRVYKRAFMAFIGLILIAMTVGILLTFTAQN